MYRFFGLLALLALPALAAEPTLYGRYEHIRLDDIGKTLKAKMDTGAMTASLSAKDIELFQREGEEWVRFRLAIEGADDTLYEHRLAGISEIKTRAEERVTADASANDGPGVARRPLIEMELCIGDQLLVSEVNLADRSHFRYPLLVGTKTIRQLDAAIDPARKYTAQPNC